MAVVIEAMRTYFFQRAAAVYFAVAGQIEMIADVAEAAVVDVVREVIDSTATRPARDSCTPCISLNTCEPVSQKAPGSW